MEAAGWVGSGQNKFGWAEATLVMGRKGEQLEGKETKEREMRLDRCCVHRPDLVGSSPALLVELGQKKGKRKKEVGGRERYGPLKTSWIFESTDQQGEDQQGEGERKRASCTMRMTGLARVEDSSKSHPISSMK
jgi:hypothetical protein